MADEDEWEYEYSTTETETYYLTLDLSIRDFLERRTDDIVHNTRAGYRVWYNPLFNAPEPVANRLESAKDTQDADDGDNADKDDQYLDKIGMPQAQGESEAPIDPLLTSQPAAETGDQVAQSSKQPENIQILELHSKEPVVSYRNHVFRGQWAENIGTEMIFTRQFEKDKDPLPMIRDMGRNIHLLANSAARINFKEVDMIPREKYEASRRTETFESYENEDDIPERYRKNGGVYIHIGGDKSGQRQPQAHFLEDLIALKRKRGETDEVTVQPYETKQNKLMVDDVEEERRRRKLQVDHERSQRWRTIQKRDNDVSLGAEEHYVARRRKKYVSEPTVKKKRGRGSRPRIRAPLVRRPTPPPQQQSGATGGGLSIPTPARWDDLPARGANTQGG
ncbi:hypothetical protein V8F06_010871 [Rhypophila decipiens]